MIPWLQTVGVLLLALLGIVAGRGCARLKTPYWFIGYIIPLLLIIMVGVARWVKIIGFLAPFSWLMMGRREFALIAVMCTVLFMTLSPKIPDSSWNACC